MIRYASAADLPDLALCHISAFPEALSSALGKRYVQRMLSWYLEDDDAFLFFIADQNRIVGYCGGMIKHPGRITGSASGMTQHSFNTAITSLCSRPWLLLHREVRSKYRFILKNIVRRLKPAPAEKTYRVSINPQQASESYTALVVIGVAKDLQGKGIGSKLLMEFENKTKSLGFHKMLLTVKSDNVQAIRSYEKNGWKKVNESTLSTMMTKTI